MKAVVTGIEHDMVLRRARVQCDECGDQYSVPMYRYPLSGERAQLVIDLRKQGWHVEGNHEQHVCPNCKGGNDDE
jgi:hypothetical protein